MAPQVNYRYELLEAQEFDTYDQSPRGRWFAYFALVAVGTIYWGLTHVMLTYDQYGTVPVSSSQPLKLIWSFRGKATVGPSLADPAVELANSLSHAYIAQEMTPGASFVPQVSYLAAQHTKKGDNSSGSGSGGADSNKSKSGASGNSSITIRCPKSDDCAAIESGSLSCFYAPHTSHLVPKLGYYASPCADVEASHCAPPTRRRLASGDYAPFAAMAAKGSDSSDCCDFIVKDDEPAGGSGGGHSSHDMEQQCKWCYSHEEACSTSLWLRCAGAPRAPDQGEWVVHAWNVLIGVGFLLYAQLANSGIWVELVSTPAMREAMEALDELRALIGAIAAVVATVIGCQQLAGCSLLATGVPACKHCDGCRCSYDNPARWREHFVGCHRLGREVWWSYTTCTTSQGSRIWQQGFLSCTGLDVHSRTSVGLFMDLQAGRCLVRGHHLCSLLNRHCARVAAL